MPDQTTGPLPAHKSSQVYVPLKRSDRRVQVWRISRESPAAIEVTENTALLAGSRANFVAASGAGVTIVGKSVNFGVLSENQRHGGLFIRMNDFLQMVPTTIVTPVPNQIPFPPFGLASSMLSDLPFFLAMLSAGAVASTLV